MQRSVKLKDSPWRLDIGLRIPEYGLRVGEEQEARCVHEDAHGSGAQVIRPHQPQFHSKIRKPGVLLQERCGRSWSVILAGDEAATEPGKKKPRPRTGYPPSFTGTGSWR